MEPLPSTWMNQLWRRNKTLPLHRFGGEGWGEGARSPRQTVLSASLSLFTARLCNRYLSIEVNILNRMKQFNPLAHRPLECFAPCYEPHSSGALVNDGCAHGLSQIVFP
jgi:hypothetical protein